jgi:hypothetical protein
MHRTHSRIATHACTLSDFFHITLVGLPAPKHLLQKNLCLLISKKQSSKNSARCAPKSITCVVQCSSLSCLCTAPCKCCPVDALSCGTLVKAVLLLLLCRAPLAIKAASKVVNVTTPNELMAAINGNSSHVHITRHLDLVELTKARNRARLAQPTGSPSDPLFTPGSDLQSLTVDLFLFQQMLVKRICILSASIYMFLCRDYRHACARALSPARCTVRTSTL